MSALVEKVKKAAKYFTPTNPKKDIIYGEGVQMFANEEKAEQAIWECLAKLGIYDDDVSLELLMSDDCKEGDARAVFCDTGKLPVPRFRKIWNILKDGAEPKQERETSGGLSKEMIQTITPVGQWSDKDLLEKYGPTCSQAVETELKVRSEMRPCIVFKNKDEVDIETSMKLLREARRREVPNVYKADGQTKKVYRISEFPEDTYTRCPVTGNILFDGYSEKIGVTWEIPYEALQFIALLVREGVQVSAITARDLQKEYKENGLAGLRDLFPKIAVRYDELKEINELPNLKATLSSRDAKMDPFGKRY